MNRSNAFGNADPEDGESADGSFTYSLSINQSDTQVVSIGGKLQTKEAIRCCAEVLSRVFAATPAGGTSIISLIALDVLSDEGADLVADAMVAQCRLARRVELRLQLTVRAPKILNRLALPSEPDLMYWDRRAECLVVSVNGESMK